MCDPCHACSLGYLTGVVPVCSLLLSFSPFFPPHPRLSPLFPSCLSLSRPPQKTSTQVLPYWGTLADRKTLRRLLTPSRLYGRAAPFHVCLTSYQMAVADEAVLKKVKWQFMILDEAQVCVCVCVFCWQICADRGGRVNCLCVCGLGGWVWGGGAERGRGETNSMSSVTGTVVDCGVRLRGMIVTGHVLGGGNFWRL